MVVGTAERALLGAFSKRSEVLNMNAVIKTFDPYEVLGVERGALYHQIKFAYRRWAKDCHPDVGGDPEAWADLQKAYDVLSDPVRRK
jgi:DnaJ-class molecular chaperone